MKINEIIRAINERLDIKNLNEMQKWLSDSAQNNIILLSPTGSGKTLAFALRLLQSVDDKSGNVRAVVLAPSRELAIQSADVIKKISGGLRVVVFYGGHSVTDEKNSLSSIPDIVVATPGRLLDHLQRGHLTLDGVTSLVIDEYDKMLELGFQDEMKKIIRKMPRLRLKILTSATKIEQLPPFIGKFEEFAVYDFTDRAEHPRKHMEIVEVPAAQDDKLDTLVELLQSLDNQKVIIFVNHRESADRVFDTLKRKKFPVGLYHGGLEQDKRRLAVELLENDTTPILVSTDIASRGLDITAVRSVIHYHLPVNEETWTHRNGRTARMGATGTIYVIVNEKDNVPDFIHFDRKLFPTKISDNPIRAEYATLYFDAGKKEKISKGDVAGFLMQKGGLDRNDVGVITVDDHYAIAAVRRDKALSAIEAVKPYKLKNRRVRVSLLR